MNIRIFGTIFFLFVWFGSIAVAAPRIGNVAGTLIDGEDVVIVGSNFGVKSTPSPLVFDNFDANDSGRRNGDQINGSACSHFGEWIDSTLDSMPTYTNKNQRKGSILSSNNYLKDSKELNHAPMFIDFANSHQQNLMITFWYRFSFDPHLDGNQKGSWQHKIWRVGNGREADGYAHFQHGWHNNNDGRGYKKFLQIFHNDVTSPKWPSNNKITKDLSGFEQGGRWQHITVFLKAGSATSGKSNIWIDGNRQTTDAELNMQTWKSGDEWKRATFAWYLGTEGWSGSQPEVWTQYDDIYIDNTWQSVWIGNNSKWEDCTHREIQIPVAWSNTSITVTVNRGSFDSGESVYLFVVDANGNANSEGIPAQIGGPAFATGYTTSEPISAPTGLKVLSK